MFMAERRGVEGTIRTRSPIETGIGAGDDPYADWRLPDQNQTNPIWKIG